MVKADELQPNSDSEGKVAIGEVVLQSSELKGDAALQAVAARRNTLQRIPGSRTVTEGVGLLQDALNALAAFDTALATIDLGDANRNRGIYDPLTEEAVRQFQSVNGLPMTGIVDAATLATIDLKLLAISGDKGRGIGDPPSTLPGDLPVTILTEKGDPIAHLKERVRNILTDVPVYKLADRNGYFFRANMAVDVDGSPRAYCPGNRDSSALDTIEDADDEGSSTTYVQGEVRAGRLGVGPSPGFYISGTSLRLSQPWRCDNFVDAEQIPYIVFPQPFHEVQLGDLAVVVNLRDYKWTHAIFADTNAHVGEASIRTAQNLGRKDLNAHNGDDNDNYVYILFPRTKFPPQQTAPYWPDDIIQANATTLFQNWGGIEQVKKLFPPV